MEFQFSLKRSRGGILAAALEGETCIEDGDRDNSRARLKPRGVLDAHSALGTVVNCVVIQNCTSQLPVTRRWSLRAVCSVTYFEPVIVVEVGNLTPLVSNVTVVQNVDVRRLSSGSWLLTHVVKSEGLRCSVTCRIYIMRQQSVIIWRLMWVCHGSYDWLPTFCVASCSPICVLTAPWRVNSTWSKSGLATSSNARRSCIRTSTSMLRLGSIAVLSVS